MIEKFQRSNISSDMKKAAHQAKDKLRIYYQKTDAAAFTVATLLDPKLKLHYHEEQKWEKRYIKAARNQLIMLFKEHYYHPRLEAESDDEAEDDMLSHIYPQHKSDSWQDEVELYLAAAKLPRKTDILEWWKVK
jgi:hypothetical protein